MIRLALAAVALALPLGLATYAATAAPAARELSRSGPIGYEVPAMGTYVRGERIFPGRYAAWTPNGDRVAFIRRNDIWVAEGDGTEAKRLTRDGRPKASLSWNPDGNRLVYERGGELWILRADMVGERLLRRGTDPDWSPDGERIVFVCEPSEGMRVLCLIGADGRGGVSLSPDGGLSGQQWAPSWSPRGTRIVYVSDVSGRPQIHSMQTDGKGLMRLTNSETDDDLPAWSPDGKRIAFVRDGAAWAMDASGKNASRVAERAVRVAWRPLPKHAQLMPDLDQRAPHSLVVTRWRGRWVVAFSSAVDNVGDGPFYLVGNRRPGTPFMDGGQRVKRADGGWAVHQGTGFWRYVYADSHEHWHFLPFERYELRDRKGEIVVRDHKSGFCLGDTFRHASWIRPDPYFFPSGACQRGNPRADTVYGGTTVGYTDRYFPNYHGQNLRLNGLPAGVYTLVHRVNPNLNFFEKRYENNAASVRIRLTWRGGVPNVRTLKVCESSPGC